MSRHDLRDVTDRPFAQWLRSFMDGTSLRVSDVAVRAQVSPKTVHEWLRGRGPLHPHHVIAKLQGPPERPQPAEPVARKRSSPEARFISTIESLVRFTQKAEGSVRRTALPAPYARRLRERVGTLTKRARAAIERTSDDLETLTAQLERELADFQQLLDVEWQARTGRRIRGQRPDPEGLRHE